MSSVTIFLFLPVQNYQQSSWKAPARIPLGARLPNRAILVRFLKNANPFFEGVVVCVSKQNWKTIEKLMEEVTGKLARHINLQRPIEKLMSADGKPINDFNQFLFGDICVCCYRNEKFVDLKYNVGVGAEERLGQQFHSLSLPSPESNILDQFDILTTIANPSASMRYRSVCGPLGVAMIQEYFLWRKEMSLSHMSDVHLVQHRYSKVLYVVKLIKKMQIESYTDWSPSREISTLRSLQSHGNIINLVLSYENQRCIVLWFEKMDCDLEQFQSRFRRMPPSLIYRIFTNLSFGLLHIHKNCIVHRDIKLTNILIRLRGEHDISELKICDFGLATWYKGQPIVEMCGTPMYMSPEMLANEGYDYKADCWAAGIVLYHLNYAQFPYENSNDIMNKFLYKTNAFYRALHPTMIRLMQNLLKKNPSKRLSSQQMVEYELPAYE